MDVLYFIKEEYAAVRAGIPALVGGDATGMQEDGLRDFLKQIELVVRVADELVLPELADQARRDIDALAAAGDQTSELSKVVASGSKTGRLADARRRELANLISSHLDFMEQMILPKFREEIPTPTREDLGIVALDFKADLGISAARIGDIRSVSGH
jgi:hypothetical protein